MADNMDELKKLKVPELRDALKVKGLPTSGTKQELINRLIEASNGTAQNDSAIDEDEILKDDSVTEAVVVPPKTTLPSSTEQSHNNNNNGIEAISESSELPTTSQSSSDAKLAKPAEVKTLTEAERLQMRADKFGVTSEKAKKEIRAQRFGIAESKSGNISTNVPPADLQKLQKRADRFGISTSSVTEDEKKRKRAERFGISLSTPSTSTKGFTLNSTDSELEAKKRKRAERFGLT